MNPYPMLHLIVRFGPVGAALLAVAAGLTIAWTTTLSTGLTIALSIATTGVAYLVLKTVVELVTLIVDMLIPR